MDIGKQRVFLDVDGVLADFVGGMCKAHGQPWPYDKPENRNERYIEKIFKLKAEDFWQPANNAEFWESLEWMPDGQEILHMLESMFQSENICLLTSPSASPYATAGKIAWIQKHVPAYRRRFFVGPAKEFCANWLNLLVDDYDENIRKFRAAGGTGILVPRPWNSRHEESDTSARAFWEDVMEYTGGYVVAPHE